MYERYESGLSLAQVGREFDLTRERVRQIFKEAGLATRGRGRAQGHDSTAPEPPSATTVAQLALRSVKLLAATLEYEQTGRLTASAQSVGIDPGALRTHLQARGYPVPPTPRQRRLLRPLAEHRSRAEIAETLGITKAGVSAEMGQLLAKLDAADRREAVSVAERFGWLSTD